MKKRNDSKYLMSCFTCNYRYGYDNCKTHGKINREEICVDYFNKTIQDYYKNKPPKE